MKEFGFVRVGASVPSLEVGNVSYNVREILKQVKEGVRKGIDILTFPELCITGYSCADLFGQEVLLKRTLEGLKEIVTETQKEKIIIVVGLPYRFQNQLFNVAAVIQSGKILGLIPKTYIPNYGEFYEGRWFASSQGLTKKETTLWNEVIPFDTKLLFQDKEDERICFGVEICEDLWTVNPPSNALALSGATILLNLSASNEVIGKYSYRKNLVSMQSSKTISAYVYASAGALESTTDVVFGGHSIIAENGSILKESERFSFTSTLITADIDVQKLMNFRMKNRSYMEVSSSLAYQIIPIDISNTAKKLERKYPKYPFVPGEKEKRNERCEEIFRMQATALARRLKHTRYQKTVIGMSGGLDSTLAFLVIVLAYQKLKLDPKNIIAITMPGFGTTDRTYQNALSLAKGYGATIREINIKEACQVHFKDIGHDENNHDITYENVQARERTQILMDVANQENALVIGTGDLSELALGWCTYNGDHMSMYAVNTSIPKTLVRYLVEWKGLQETNKCLKNIILDIVDTPVSPELLPPKKSGEIEQLTESSVGPYVLNDFFLYHFLRYGASPKKILKLAKDTFVSDFKEEEIQKYLQKFIQRFFTQQFKRSCLPDGPKVGTVAVSPRGDLRMPSDASYEDFMREIL